MYAVSVSYKFGLVAMLAGALGVPAGALLSERLRRSHGHADPLLCAAALLTSMPLVFAALVAAASRRALTYALIFFGELTLNLTWSVVADMVLVSDSVIISQRKSTTARFRKLKLQYYYDFYSSDIPMRFKIKTDYLRSFWHVKAYCNCCL